MLICWYYYRTLFNFNCLEWRQIFLHWTPLRLNFCSLVSVNNSRLLANIHNSSLNITYSDQNPRLHIRWISHLFWPDLICLQILLLPYSSASLYTSTLRYEYSFRHRHFRCSHQVWLLQVKHNLPSLRSPGSNRFRTLLHVLLSKLPNSVTPLPSFGLCTG